MVYLLSVPNPSKAGLNYTLRALNIASHPPSSLPSRTSPKSPPLPQVTSHTDPDSGRATLPDILPNLPTELKKAILRFCDPPTLATTSLVNLAFLELSSPLLYQEATVEGWDSLRMMLCRRTTRPQPQIDPFLSLGQMKHLTFHHVLSPRGNDALSPHRIPHSGSSSPQLLSLFSFTLFLGSAPLNQRRRHALLSILDPTTFILHGVQSAIKSGSVAQLHLENPLPNWTRLRSLVLVSAECFVNDRILSRSTASELTVVYDLSESSDWGDVVERLALRLALRWSAKRGTAEWLRAGAGGGLGTRLRVILATVEEVSKLKGNLRSQLEASSWRTHFGMDAEGVEAMLQGCLMEVKEGS